MTTEWVSPGRVAEAHGVSPKTVGRWADAGLIESKRTAGGHRRYHRDALNSVARPQLVQGNKPGWQHRRTIEEHTHA